MYEASIDVRGQTTSSLAARSVSVSRCDYKWVCCHFCQGARYGLQSLKIVGQVMEVSIDRGWHTRHYSSFPQQRRRFGSNNEPHTFLGSTGNRRAVQLLAHQNKKQLERLEQPQLRPRQLSSKWKCIIFGIYCVKMSDTQR